MCHHLTIELQQSLHFPLFFCCLPLALLLVKRLYNHNVLLKCTEECVYFANLPWSTHKGGHVFVFVLVFVFVFVFCLFPLNFAKTVHCTGCVCLGSRALVNRERGSSRCIQQLH